MSKKRSWAHKTPSYISRVTLLGAETARKTSVFQGSRPDPTLLKPETFIGFNPAKIVISQQMRQGRFLSIEDTAAAQPCRLWTVPDKLTSMPVSRPSSCPYLLLSCHLVWIIGRHCLRHLAHVLPVEVFADELTSIHQSRQLYSRIHVHAVQHINNIFCSYVP